jgi:hypothetical protein
MNIAATILAGNVAHIDRTFTRVGAGSLVGTVASVAVTNPTGTSTALTGETVTIDNTAGTVNVAADWAIADAATGGVYTITIDVGGGMIAAYETKVYVTARTLATVPA